MTHLLLGREAIPNIHISSPLRCLTVPLDHDSLISIHLGISGLMVILVTLSTVLRALLIVYHLLSSRMAFLLLLDFWRYSDVSWYRVACLLVWYHYEIPSIAIVDPWIQVVLQVKHVGLAGCLSTVVRRVNFTWILANGRWLLETLVLRAHEFLNHLSSIWLGERPIVSLSGAHSGSIWFSLVDEAVIFLHKGRVVLHVLSLAHVLVVFNGKLWAFRVENLGLTLTVLDTSCSNLDISTYLCG